ncbi:Cold-regulated protein, partial [Sesbania bispinosa]
MGRILMQYLAMKTDHPVTASVIHSDLDELKHAAKKLFHDATLLGGKGFGTSFLKGLASFAA